MELIADHVPLMGWQIGVGHEIGHKVPIAAICGNAAGAGVGVGQEASLLQRSQVIADGRSADTQIVLLRDRLAAHRQGILHIFLDDDSQHLFTALAQLQFGHKLPAERTAACLPSIQRAGYAAGGWQVELSSSLPQADASDLPLALL